MPFVTTGVIAGTLIGIGMSGAGTIGAAVAGGVIGAAAGVAGGLWAKDALSGDKDQKQLENQQLPAMQTIEELSAEERKKADRLRAGKSDTILTSPLGDTAEPNVKKVTLGQ